MQPRTTSLAAGRLLIALLLSVAALAPPCAGHGYLLSPRARNVVAWQAGTFYDPASGNGLGLKSPPQTPGVCGDPFQGITTDFVNQPTTSQATYAPGQTVTLNVTITANHGGKFAFRLCARNTNLDEGCFGSNYLVRADNGQRDTWIQSAAPSYTMQYVVPAGITGAVVLQWQYTAMQTCIPAGCDRTYCGVYADGHNPITGNPGFCSATTQPELFNNCADITINAGGPAAATSPVPSPSASPKPSPSPVPSPSPSPKASPLPSPSPSPKPAPSPSPVPSPVPSPSPSGSVVCSGCADATCYCKAAPNGVYANPWDATCQTFLQCSNGVTYTQKCGTGLIYDRVAKACNWATSTACTRNCP